MKTPLKPRIESVKSAGYTLLTIAVFGVSLFLLDVDTAGFIERLSRLQVVVAQFLILDFAFIWVLLEGMLTSIMLSFVSLVLGGFTALILSFLAASNIGPFRMGTIFIKGFVSLIRAIPSLIWALMVIASFGFGNIGGVITLFISTVGFLTKAFTTAIEDAGDEIIEALRATGAPWLLIVLKGLIPTVLTSIITWFAVRGESSVSESISLGIIGVAGIGFTLTRSIARFQYGQITLGVIIIFVTMFALELATQTAKKSLRKSE